MLSDKPGAKTQLGPTTPEFAHLEYTLQLTLKSSTARIVNAYSLSNPHLNIQFDRRCKDILTLPCWVESHRMEGANTEDDVIRRGFHFQSPQSGIKMRAGQIELNNSKGIRVFNVDNGLDQNLHKALMCLVAVGRAFVADPATSERDVIPDGYDSFYIQDVQNESVPSENAKGWQQLNQTHPKNIITTTSSRTLPKFFRST